ncbi:MAG: SusC/RagA family TonB-linked outer membrane protein [Balneolales bacterium]
MLYTLHKNLFRVVSMLTMGLCFIFNGLALGQYASEPPIPDAPESAMISGENQTSNELLNSAPIEFNEENRFALNKAGEHSTDQGSGNFVAQEEVSLSGTVMDDSGLLAGVNVLIRGSNRGTTTNANGEFEITAESDVVLIFSMVGYANVEINTETTSQDLDNLEIMLSEESLSLGELTVMGYSEVETRHVASSVASIDVERMRASPIVKLEEAFHGTIPGVTLQQGHNLPGSGPGAPSIRGISTLQNASPLVMVDGMEQSLSDIDPNQIRSITVLKDAASASMYGSRGANGVILIETERGRADEFSVDVHSWSAVNNPIDLPDFVNSADYMLLRNEARSIQGQTAAFTDEEMTLANNGEYTNTNWMDAVMQQQAYSHNTSANISGGGGVGAFNLMLGYEQEGGLNQYEGTDQFSARFNTNINIDDRFVLLADFYAHRLQVDRLQANSDGHGLYQNVWRMNPTQDINYESDLEDHYVLYNNLNPIASMEQGGARNNLYDRSSINLRPTYHINDKLNISGNLSYLINKSAYKYKRETFKFFDGDGVPVETWANSVGSSQGVSASQLTGRALLNYETELRSGHDKIYITAGTETMNHTYTDYREITKASFFNKVNYSLDNRYILEATVRADGSSKFAPGNRWGYFPSGALAWNIHNEGFLSGLKDSGALTNLKLRVSYGLIGKENVDPYLWQEIVNNWGWTMRTPNPSFSWETQEQANIGIEITTFNDRLDLAADAYTKHSKDLIYDAFPIPPLTGSHSLESSVNIGEVENTGWELSANWYDQVGNFSYNVGSMLFDNQNQVLKAGYSASDTLIFKDNDDQIWYRGIALENYYGMETDGYFQTQDELDATTAKLPNTMVGDIRYIDQNEDGVINDNDKVDLGDPFPHLNYSFTVDLNYKRWDFSVLGQGVGKRTGRLSGMEGFPVRMDGSSNDLGTPSQYYMDNRWSADNPDSRFPRVWTGSTPNEVLSDVWLSDASYFRIKTIQLGYTIPNIGESFRNVRIYANARDMFTFTNYEGLEPERNGGNGNYPRMASFSLGIRATIY